MISTDEMSSTSMDISESFRPEDLSKTDFFDFVSASEMGIGVGISNVGVGISLQAQHHQYQDQSHQQQPQNHERLSTNSNMIHDGGGTAGGNNNDISSNSMRNGSNSDPTLPNYEFWHSDKDSNRLDSSIFEDLDRYCWQQQQANAASTHTHHTPANQNTNNRTHSDGTGTTATALNCDSSLANSTATRTNLSVNSNDGGSNISQANSNTNPLSTTNVHNSDGQIYTITVLNSGNETATSTSATSWLKREPEETQIPPSLDLDSLLGNFSGYIKSEYPYDDSGFSTDGTKEAINGDANGISIQQQQQEASALHVMSNLGNGGGQALPSLVTSISGGRACVNIGQELAAQFQNNNNDWHMIDHNSEHNSAESLLRSALQGKGYTKGVHHMHNGGIALIPASPTNKDDEMRRILFSAEADSLAFADSTLNTAQIFEDSQHHTNLIQLHSNTPVTGTTPNAPISQPNHGNSSSSLMVDDMFLTLENAFSDDFDKMKRIANEVQQYCNTPPVDSDYIGSDIMMQISPTAATVGTTATQLQPLHSPVTTTPSIMVNIVPPPTSKLAAATATHHLQQQHHKPEVTTVTTPTVNAPMSSKNSRMNITKATKKYKRVSNTISNANNNNSLSAINNNNNNNNISSIHNNNNKNQQITKNLSSNINSSSNNSNSAINSNATPSSGASSSSSSNSPPTAHCNGQRKERSLHYCSICSKGFKDKYSVNVHIRTHTGEKPFACSLCGKSFRQKAHLAKHYQTHMAQKNNHGTGIIKSNSSKHHRTSATPITSNSATATQQRQISMLTGSSIASQISGTTVHGSSSTNMGLGINPNLLGVTSTVVTLNGPTSSVNLASNALTPPNSLLANR